MATIDQIADGESGLSVREKLNQVHDQIVEISAGYIQVQADDVVIGTAAVAFDIDLLSVTAAPPSDAIKALTVFNLPGSVADITLLPFGAETIDGLTSLVITPGMVATITPTSTEWITHPGGIVDSVNGSTNITISGPAEDPIVSLNTEITGTRVNGVMLSSTGSAGDFLQADGGYSLINTSVTGGNNITNSGTAAAAVLDLDSIITGMTVNGVVLNSAGDNFEYLAEDGQYTVPTGNIVEVSTAYTQVVRDDVIIGTGGVAFTIDLILLSTAVKAITIRNDATATITLDGNGAETIEGNATFALAPGTSIILVPTSGTDWVEVGEAGIQSVQAGTNISVDNTDSANPEVSVIANMQNQAVNNVTLTDAGSGGVNYLDDNGDYSIPPQTGAQKALLTLQAFTEQDIIDELGSGPIWNLSGYNLQIMANITLSTNNNFLIDTAGATVEGVDRNLSSITGDSGQALFNFTADSASDTDLQFRLSNVTLTQSGIGGLLRQDGTRFIVEFDNCGLTGNTTGGNITLFNGQFIGFSDGVLQGGSSITQGDGTSGSPGVEFIFFRKNFLGITDLFANDQRFIELLPNSVTKRISAETFSIQINPDFGFTAQRTGGIGLYIHKGAQVDILNYMGGGFNPLHASSRQIAVEDPSSVKFGLMGGNTFEGAGELYQFESSTPDSTIALDNVWGLGFDGTNLLATSDDNSGSSTLVQYTGLTSTPLSTIASPDNRPTDVDWLRGNMISLGKETTQGIVYLHDGFSTTIDDQVSLSAVGIAFGRGLTTDGTNIIIVDSIAREVHVFGADFFTATTPVAIKIFTVPGTGTLNGCSYDGINLILSDFGNNTILVMKGISPIIQYEFASQATTLLGVTVLPTGYAESDEVAETIDIFDESLTFDQSSPNWEIMGNVGDQEQIKVDPINDTLWTTSNSGTVDDTGAVLTLTNGAAAVGTADFPLECVPGHTYRVTNGYTPGTSATAGFAILDEALATVVSDTVSVAGDVVLTFKAPDQAMTFRFTNPPAVSGETSILTSLTQIDESYKIIESSDKGGSIFNDVTARPFSPVLAQNVLSDVSDGGTDIFYGPFTSREKGRLSDEANGTVTITSVRDSGQTIQGSFVAMIASAGTNQYEALITINGEPQEDSVGTNVWIGNNDVRTITTQAITRDVTDTDEIKLQVRPIGQSNNLSVLRCAVSHTE